MPRTDAHKVTGATTYLADLLIPNVSHAAVVRSQCPHARLLHVDTAKAARVPGVHAILTGADLLENGVPLRYGPIIRDQPIVAWGRIRYAGEAIAAIAAAELSAAQEAASLIEIDYDPLPAVLTVDDALAPGAPRIHEALERTGIYIDLKDITPDPSRNLANVFRMTLGDPASVWPTAPVVSEGHYSLPPVQHYALEPHAVVASWEAGKLDIWASNHAPFFLRSELARLFGLRPEQVRIRVPYLGGGFGAKAYVTVEPLVVALARKAGRPVRLVLTPADIFSLVHTRHGAEVTVKLAADRTGCLLAAEIRCLYDTGAYADTGPRVAQKAGYTALGPYTVPNLAVESLSVYTNKVTAGAYRGYGVAQTAWAVEQQIDELARGLEMDPIDLRLRNLSDHAHSPYTDGGGIGASARQCLLKVRDLLAAPGPVGPGRGRGVALALKATVTPSLSRAKIRLDRDGVTILTGTIEKGQGAETTFCQIVSQALGIPLARVRVEPFDTEVAPYDQMTGSSRSTFSMGTALLRAAEDLQTRLRALAGDVLGVPPHHVALEGGDIVDTAHPERRVSWDALLERAGADGMYGEGVSDTSQVALPGPGQIASAFWMVAAGGAEVEIDRESGVVTTVRYVTAADAGKAINPVACEAQLEGSVMMGLGPTLFEQLVWEDGILMTDGLLTYTLPTMTHLPDLQVAVEELPDPNGPYGAKGIGEVAIVPVAPAIANAVRACSGIRPHALPMTPERMWRLFRSQKHADVAPDLGRHG